MQRPYILPTGARITCKIREKGVLRIYYVRLGKPGMVTVIL